VNEMTKFADQLLNDLMREHGETLAAVQRPAAPTRRSVRRPVWAAGLAAGAVGAGTAGVVLLGGSPAYAVTQNGDGTVKIAVNRASGIPEANAVLKGKGLNVVLVPVGSGCPDLNSLAVPATPGTKFTTNATGDNNGSSITVDAQGVPPGQTALVGVESVNGRTSMAMALIEGTPPECVSLPAIPPQAPPVGGGDSEGGTSVVPNPQDDGPSFNRSGVTTR
jgi:hypothetical protein